LAKISKHFAGTIVLASLLLLAV